MHVEHKVVVAVGGAYVVRNQFIKTSPVEQARLDVGKIQEQIQNPQELPEFTPAPVPELAVGPATYDPKQEKEIENQDRPGFTITPPSGWSKSDEIFFGYLGPEKDEEELDSGLIYFQPPNIQVALTKLSVEYENVDEMWEAIMAKETNYEILNVERTTLNGYDAYFSESRARLPEGVISHIYSYSFYRNGYFVVVGGASLESAWTKNSAVIQSSLKTFKFTD